MFNYLVIIAGGFLFVLSLVFGAKQIGPKSQAYIKNKYPKFYFKNKNLVDCIITYIIMGFSFGILALQIIVPPITFFALVGIGALFLAYVRLSSRKD
tara:strand:- start:455 stop:745 length:291 start_codon:yes stop_codon:yes gene_type:complete